MIISLEEAKLFLRVDSGEEDTLIVQFIITAEDICEGILRYPLSEFAFKSTPETIKQAILYAVANMYEKRENFNPREVLSLMSSLLFLYRKEIW